MTISVNAEDFGEKFVAACIAAVEGEEVFLVRDGVRLGQLIPYVPPETEGPPCI